MRSPSGLFGSLAPFENAAQPKKGTIALHNAQSDVVRFHLFLITLTAVNRLVNLLEVRESFMKLFSVVACKIKQDEMVINLKL